MKNNNYTKKPIAIFRNWLAAFVLVAFCSFNSMAQVAVTNPGNTTPGLAATYTSLANAITDLNLQTAISGPVIITLTGNESAPAGGYSITAILTGASALNNVIIQGSGSTITASGALTVGALNDAIFKVIGSDFITVRNFTMLENTANTVTTAASNNMTEWGVALLYATATNGAQNITIQNNTITLNRTYQNTFGIYSNSTHTTTSVTASVTATTTAGGNSGLKIYNNAISNVNNGITVIGPTAAADMNNGVDIGGASAATANTLTDWGTTGTFSGYANVSGTVNGILVRNSTTINVSFNTITSSVGGTISGTLSGINLIAFSNAPTGTYTNTINNNNISCQSGLASGAINGITVATTTGTATTTLNISNNNFNTFGHTVAGTAAITLIINAMATLVQNINSNTFTNISCNTTGSFTFMSNNVALPTGGSVTANSNSIVTAFSKTGAGGTVTLYLTSTTPSSAVGTTKSEQTNNFSNITLTGATAMAGWTDLEGATGGGSTKTISGNTFSNWTCGTSSITVIATNFSGNGTTVSNNTISGITYAPAAAGTTLTGISIGASNGGAAQTCSFNTISGLTSNAIGGQVIGILGGSTGITTFNINNNSVSGITSASTAGPVVAGIFNQNTGTTVNIFKNKVYDITSQAVIGINSTGTAATNTINISNNYIGRLYAPVSAFFQAARGILVQSTVAATFNLYYNTVYLDGTVPTQTYCVYIGGATVNVPNVNAINNVFVNNVTSSNGAALPQTVYFRFGTTNATNLAATTNNNVLYCGTPSVDHLIYADGAVNALTNPQQTLANYQALVATRESASKTELPPFLNTTTGGGANYLHISNVIATQLESGAIPVAGISDDYDNDARNATTPDIGADEFNGIAPVILDLSITALTSPANVSCFTGSENVIVQIRNAGNQPWDFSNGTFARTISGTVTNGSPAAFGPITITNAMNGGVPLAANATMTVTLGVLINMQTPQTYTFNANLSASAAEAGPGSGTGNDALSPAVTRTSTNPTVTLSSNSPVCANSPLILTANSSGGNNNVPVVFSGSASPNVAIPDISLTGASSTIAIAGGGNILPATAIDVTLNITHTFNGDIDAYLVGPGNCGALELTTDNGSTSDGFSNLILHTTGAFPNVTTLPTIVGANGGNFMTELGVTTPPVAGSGTGSANYPAVPLIALNGCPINGTWTLFVGDDATGDVGTINNWSLSIGGLSTGNYTDNFTGTGSYSIVYSGANNSTGTNTVTGAATGTYTVTTTDANGCTSAPATTPVTVRALPTGSLSNGSTTVCNDPTPPTSFFDVFFTVDPPGSTVNGTINPGAIPFSGNVSPISVGVSPASSTTYTIGSLSMSGAPSCAATSLTGTYTVNTDFTPAAPIVTSPVTYCQNAITSPLTATGTNLLWYPTPSGGIGSPTAPTPSSAVVGSTNYYVSQTPIVCESPRALIVVTVVQPPNTAFAGPDQTIVNINSATMAANTAVAGTTGTWSVISGTGTFSPNVNDPNATVTGMSVGNNVYRWTISNPPCADSFDEMTVNFSGCPVLTPTISGTSSFCQGSSTQLCAPAAFASYSWSTGATTQCITVSTANTFTVTVSDINGCTGTASRTTTVNPLPSCLITGNGSICSGSSTQWCAPSGLSYLWSTGATTQCITVSTAGTRTVTVTDGNGCSSSCNKTLTVNPLPNCLITGNGSICSGSSTQWCAPSGLASYLWSTGATTQCITVSTANTFTVTVTDGNGCSSSCNKTLTVNPNPTPNISGTLSFCSGSSTQICAPAGLSSYQWSTGATTQCITVSTANTFTVTVTNANGCSGSTSATTTVNPLPSCLITGNGSICSGSSTQWCAPSGLSYLWSTGATTQCITVSTAGTRTVTVTDGNGCSSSCNKSLTVNPLPSCLITGNGSICSGSSTQWCAPSGLASYLWSTGATTQCITVSTANTFTVTVTDGNGCSSSCNKTLTVNPNPTPNISGTLSFCSGSSTQICAPAGLSSYLWSTGATTQCITVSSANTFTVTVTNANGCSGSTSATTTVNPLPTISTTGPLNLNNTPGFCSATVTNAQLMGQVTSVTGTPPPTVTFSPPAGTFPVGTTLVTATATNICGAPTSSFNVIVNDNQNPTIVCPPPVTVNTNPGVCYATNINFGIPGFGDNCSGATVGNNALAQYPSGQFPQGGIVIQWEVTDQSGNKASCNQTVAIVDNEPPVALCKNLCVYLNSAGVAIITGADIDNGSHDNCGIDPGPNGLVASPNTFTYANAGPNTVTLTVKDINGNTSTCTSTVTVGEYYSLFGADGSCSTPTGQPDNCHVNMGNGNNITGNVGSYRLITTGGGVVINGNVISGGKVNYANGVSSKSVSAANLLGLPGLIFQTGSAANITGDINVTGNINVNQNGGSFVTGIVRHPVGTTYSGPVPGGGVLLAPAVLPALPGMPTINAYSCGGANITTTATLNPGSYGNMILGNAAGVIITFNGPGNYYFSSIKMAQGGIHTFKYDFLGLPGKINIFVCGDINFGQHESQWANPNTPDACRVYFETHGTGSTNGTNSVMAAIIELGSHFYGRVWAPYGGIKVGSGSCCTYATGSLWSAKQVQLEGAVTFNGCSSPCPPAPRTNEEFTATDNLNSKLQVYPNPTSGKTTVAFFTEIPYSYTLKVMDYQGRVVLSNESKAIAGDNTQEIDMSQFAKGLYLIEVGNPDHSQKVKVVVQ